MTDLMSTTEERVKDERKRYESIWWGGALVWIGLALGAEYLDLLPEIGDTGEWWPWIFVGLGPWALILNGYQLLSTEAPNPTAWDWIWTVVFMGVAISAVFDVGGEIVGATALVIIGLVVLLRTLRRD